MSSRKAVFAGFAAVGAAVTVAAVLGSSKAPAPAPVKPNGLQLQSKVAIDTSGHRVTVAGECLTQLDPCVERIHRGDKATADGGHQAKTVTFVFTGP